MDDVERDAAIGALQRENAVMRLIFTEVLYELAVRVELPEAQEPWAASFIRRLHLVMDQAEMDHPEVDGFEEARGHIDRIGADLIRSLRNR